MATAHEFRALANVAERLLDELRGHERRALAAEQDQAAEQPDDVSRETSNEGGTAEQVDVTHPADVSRETSPPEATS